MKSLSKQTLRFAKIALTIFLLALPLWNILRGWEDVREYGERLNPLALLGTFLLLLGVYAEAAFSWHILLRRARQSIPFAESFPIWIISNVSRYLPGIIWQYVGRIELARRQSNLSREVSLLSIIAEVFFNLLAGVLIGFLSLTVVGSQTFGISPWLFLAIALFLLVLHPSMISRARSLIMKKFQKKEDAISFRLTRADLGVGIFWFSLNYVFHGLALWMLIQAFGSSLPVLSIPGIAGIYATSWLIGYLSPVSPGGLGAADVSLAYFLGLIIPLPLASGVAIVYRLLLIAAEVVSFGIAVRMSPSRTRQ